MMSTFKFIRRNRIAVILVLAVSLAANMAQPMRMDDATFLQTFTAHGNDLWSWGQEYWVTWSGRIVPHGIFMILLSLSPELVNILNAVMTTLSLVLSCMWVFEGREDHPVSESLMLMLMAAVLYLFTPTDILDVTIFWKTASVLYIWGFAAMLYALLPFMKALTVPEKANAASDSTRAGKTNTASDSTSAGKANAASARTQSGRSKRLRSASVRKRSGQMQPTPAVSKLVLPAFASVYCAGFEQSGSFYFAFGGIVIILALVSRKLKNIPPYACVLWILTSAAFFLFLSAPGNMVRFREEALFWFPNYGLYTFTDKLLLGTSYTIGACLHEMYLPMTALALIVFLLMVARRRGIVLTLTALLPVLYYGAYSVASDSPVYAFVYSDVYGFYTAANWFATFLGMFMIIVTALMIFIGINDEFDFMNTLFFCGAIAEQVVMGFTPTVAVSISRSTFFSRELLLIPVCTLLLRLIRSIRTDNNDRKDST